MLHYDLIIVGGGLAGSGLALALRDTNLQVALVDARVPDTNDPRLFALNSSSCQFLHHLAVWQDVAAHAAPIHQVHVSRQGHFGTVRLNREEVNMESLGHVVPACHIETAMQEKLAHLKNVTVYRPAKLTALRQENSHADLTINTHEGEINLQAAIVIGADGADSTVRAQLNIPAEEHDYGQSAIVTRTKLRRPHKNIAYERFTANGAIAMLPLMEDECATIWTADHAAIAQLMTQPDEMFLQTLQKEFGYRLGRLQKITRRHVFSLKMVRAKKNALKQTFLLGNSAHTLHPIAAQGFNLALYEVAALAEGIMSRQTKQGPFTAEDLQQVSDQVQKQQTVSIGVSHRLAKLFQGGFLLRSIMLQLGMMGLDITMPVKRKFIKEMMGRESNPSHLLLGTIAGTNA